ncbi:hypothetical protein SRABI76_03359 [Microbacterium oxydans]|uniref:hypothetical protein n=1 Tax=Microbacterium oxydans TaxID=82380 RepID=UPI001D3F5357|nr:hypothetical protein [Microbacterium oxydans]CAH0255746.1 hypothetical protein SRABI76_03359 [Microbacterium oxydans]
MTTGHVHRDLHNVPMRVREFRKATADDQLVALAELHKRANGQSPSTWSNGILAIVPTISLFGTMLLAAYGIWAQGGLAYWNLYTAPIEDEAGWSTSQTERWADAITSIVDDPNALAGGLTGWAQGLVLVLLIATFIAIALSAWSSHVRGVASAWIAVYERALDAPPPARPCRGKLFMQRAAFGRGGMSRTP